MFLLNVLGVFDGYESAPPSLDTLIYYIILSSEVNKGWIKYFTGLLLWKRVLQAIYWKKTNDPGGVPGSTDVTLSSSLFSCSKAVWVSELPY